MGSLLKQYLPNGVMKVVSSLDSGTNGMTEHTPWCSGMVVVPKKSGEVWICVDLKELN